MSNLLLNFLVKPLMLSSLILFIVAGLISCREDCTNCEDAMPAERYISARVQSQDSIKPIPQLEVLMKSTDGRVIFRGFTDDDGEFYTECSSIHNSFRIDIHDADSVRNGYFHDMDTVVEANGRMEFMVNLWMKRR